MDNELHTDQPATDLFAEEELFHYEPASTGQRFVNWLVDNLLMRFGLTWLSGYLVGYFLANYFPDFYLNMIYSKGFEWYFTIYMITFLNYFIYYTFCEKVFKGYTLGKVITGTRAVQEDGKELSLKNAVLRTLSRIVPFETFSGFSASPWHDSWTKTMVIKSR